MPEPIAAPTLTYAKRPRELVCEETANGIRIYLPFRMREKFYFAGVQSVLILLALGSTLLAAIDFSGLLGRGFGLAMLLGFGSLIFLLVIACVLVVRYMRGTILEYDGSVLRASGYASTKVREWPRAKIRKVSVFRWPVIPLANVRLQVGYDTVRVGFYHPSELAEAISKLRIAMKL